MTRSGNRIVCGDFDALREVVEFTGIAGRWVNTENHCQFRSVSKAVLNYWKTTGTITFQGPELAAAELKAVRRARKPRPRPSSRTWHAIGCSRLLKRAVLIK
jgi:hypothetical protein